MVENSPSVVVECGTQYRVITAVVLLASYVFFIVDVTVVFIGFVEALKKRKRCRMFFFPCVLKWLLCLLEEVGERVRQTD